MTPFPWAAAMRFGFGVLRLSSQAFWQLTPRELAAAWAAVAGEQVRPPGRSELETMMARFPDGR
ncbi:rcc01693 family protein [uncultured Devosia sp.]|uniref:rcc01693 family protein n=1 Tax=uncultured Devosia sp. TaxID=211434 RepID=UPI0035CBA2BE